MKVIDFNEYTERNSPHIIQEQICVYCHKRWISVRPVNTLLKDLECPKCGQTGFVIATGEGVEGG